MVKNFVYEATPTVLHWTMSKWRACAEGSSFGFDLGDGLPPLLDLRLADDMLIFARSSHEIMTLLDKVAQFLGDAGLKLNAEKTVLITTQAQPPPFLTTSTGAVLKVKEKEAGHKWLGCITIYSLRVKHFFANKLIFFEPKCIHEKQIEILQCHRDTNRLFWSWAPMHPQCRYGQT